MSKSAVLGLISGLTVVVLTLIVVAVVNLPQAEGAVSSFRATGVRCAVSDVAQDQGYGVTRVVKQEVCTALDR